MHARKTILIIDHYTIKKQTPLELYIKQRTNALVLGFAALSLFTPTNSEFEFSCSNTKRSRNKVMQEKKNTRIPNILLDNRISIKKVHIKLLI